ncbi:peptide/nickel transport system substrate-binding protein [Actinopolymorpha cephalotaxi]|uniref:Peptide/nickel transport system substrate-binding protein n=1 Tax=Actinopolymorpha cephalotaxi TaxID=504797 RepID=A0A1I2NLL2_9ACTN|nr:ABC transporter substrate-binding protein [Actinopolymorpha cephalotaxi]NYH85451.1 peptide/nickel transport system substrate-binding protein [Actinopolymorpha cephalotaxi]SFG04784.1 peptide/nickel transport system substrate-binding protein [Actinopolymorpha cephalotaxi]
MSGFGRPRRFGVCAASVAAVAMASAMSACSLLPGGSSDDSSAPRNVSTYDEAQDAKAKAPAAAVQDARSGGTLHVLSSATPHTFDPTRVYHLDTLAIMRMVTRGLTQTKYVKGKPVLVPDLATDLGRPNADFTRWEFTLRDGVKYEDGSPVKAADVAYAIKRQLAQDELSGGPTYGLDYYLGGDSYKGPYKSGDDFEGVDTPDEKTVVVKMRKPFPSMRYYTSLPTFTPIPKAKDTRDDYGNHPLATGPYKFGSYDPGKKLVLVKNPEWDPKTDPNRHQYVDQMVFDFGLDTNEVQRRVIADKAEDQTALTYADILASNYDEIRGTDARRRLVTGPSPCSNYMWMDTRKIPLEVRRAVARAWPLTSENRAGGEIPGLTWRPATTIMPSATPGWQDFDVIGNKGEGDGDPAAAKKLLTDAGQLGFELSFYYSSDDELEAKIAAVRKKALTRAGFTVKTMAAPSSLARDLSDDSIRPANLRQGSWCMDWASGDSVLPAILDGKKADLPGAPVPSFLDVSAVNDEIDRISDLPAQKALTAWGQLDKTIMEKYLPAVPLGEGGTTVLHGSRVGNVIIDSVGGMPDFSQVYVR